MLSELLPLIEEGDFLLNIVKREKDEKINSIKKNPDIVSDFFIKSIKYIAEPLTTEVARFLSTI